MGELKTSELLRSLSRSEANRVIDSAGIKRVILLDSPISLAPDEVSSLLPVLLRTIKLTDEQFRSLLVESTGVANAERYSPPARVFVTIPYANVSGEQGIPVTELVSAAVIVWELSVRVAATFEAVLEMDPLRPPEVLVAPGSTKLEISGGLIVAGVALVILACSNLPSAGLVTGLGGAFTLSLGVIDKMTNWGKTRAETRLIQARAMLTEAKAEEEGKARKPASSLVPPEIVKTASREYGLDEATAAHLLNQVAPAYLALIRAHSGIPASIATGKGKAHGVGA